LLFLVNVEYICALGHEQLEIGGVGAGSRKVNWLVKLIVHNVDVGALLQKGFEHHNVGVDAG